MRARIVAILAALVALAALSAAVPAARAQAFFPLLQWGTPGSGNGQFTTPVATAAGPSGFVYVVDQGNQRIQKFDTSGDFILAWGGAGSGAGQFSTPSGVAADRTGHVFVVDKGNNRIQVFDTSGSFTGQWGSTGSGNGQFNMPTGIALDTLGNVYITDTNNNRVQKFTGAGAYVTQWGGVSAPKAIATDRRGNVYTGDNTTIKEFTSAGSLLTSLPLTSAGLATDAGRNLFVVAKNGMTVTMYDTLFVQASQWGGLGSDLGEFHSAQGITVDDSGFVYVADTGNSRIQKFADRITVELSSNQNPSLTGEAVIFTATLSRPDATGTVVFYAGGSRFDSAAVSNSHASVQTSSLSNGVSVITAHYSGDETYDPAASGPYSQTVTSNPMALMSAPNPSTFGQAVTLTATYFPNTATGKVYFYRSSVLIDSASLASGSASILTTTLPAGTDSLHATYPGDGVHISAAATALQVVNRAATATVLAAAPNPSVNGQQVTLTATVSPAVVTGKVYYYVDAALFDSAVVSGATAVLHTTTLPIGSFAVSATYGGAPDYLPSSSAPLTQVVTSPGNSVVLGGLPNPSLYGQLVTLTATVTPGTASGIVRFLRGAAVLDSATLASGVATRNIASLPAGLDSLTAYYVGNQYYSPATSPVFVQTVNKSGTTTSLALAPNPSGTGQAVTFTASVTVVSPGSGTPGGTVQFSVDGVPQGAPVTLLGGIAVYSTTAIAPGTASIVAAYNGSSNYQASGSNGMPQVVLPLESALDFLGQWGSAGGAPGQFSAPRGIALDAAGNVYVADTGNDRIQKFNPKGVLITQWGSTGLGAGQFSSPGAVTVDGDGFVYVADTGNHRVQKFSSGGFYSTQWGGMGSGLGYFLSPSGIAASPNGNIYVVDTGNNRVQAFSSTGTLSSFWGSGGSGNGQFNAPIGIAVDPSGAVFVSDAGNQRIQKFDAIGSFQLAWGGAGSGNGQFNNPAGLACDASGNLYVIDGGGNRIQKFTGTGAYLSQWGTVGNGAGNFLAPLGVAAQGAGSVYVCDTGNNRVERYLKLQRIRSIQDVGNDQGRSVRLAFTPNGLDAAGSDITPIVRYDLFRRIDSQAPVTGGATGAGVRAPARGAVALRGVAPGAVQLAGWDQVASVGAYQDTIYNQVLPTLADSNSSGLRWSVFFVRAATAVPSIYYDSPLDSGYSVDNLPPATPTVFTAVVAGGVTALHWGTNSAPDLAGFHLYRGTSAAFTADSSTLIATTADTGYVDPVSTSLYYKLAAFDYNGNQSGTALVHTASPTGVDGPDAPRVLSLSPPAPNPAGGPARMRYGLPLAAARTLDVLGVDGRIVRRLARGAASPGRYEATWDLRDERGSPVKSGLYFVRLAAGGETRTARLVVVR